MNGNILKSLSYDYPFKVSNPTVIRDIFLLASTVCKVMFCRKSKILAKSVTVMK